VGRQAVDLFGKEDGLISFYNNGTDGYHVVIAKAGDVLSIKVTLGQLKVLAESLPVEKRGRHEAD
jgi:hypothetical protein